MTYQVVLPKSARKEIQALPATVRDRIIQRVRDLADDPRPPGCVKLKGYQDIYRIRVGDYRVRYTVRDKDATVVVLNCQHRKDVYRD